VYLAGQLQTAAVKDGDRSVTVALIDRFAFRPRDFLDVATQIIRQQCAFIGENAFPDFVVTAVPVGEPLKRGDAHISGVGLFNSFALFVAPQAELDDTVEHLFAHELFHYWNGRLITAADPERAIFWFIEGITDYYTLRILYESGRWPASQYARWINRHIRQYHENPAIHATNEQIEREFWAKRDTVGEVAYQRGLLLGLRWHRLARDHGVSEGLDRLLRTLLARARADGEPITNASLRAAGVELLGTWFGDEFDRYVASAATIELPADCLAPLLTSDIVDTFAYELGFDRQRTLKDKKVRGLKKGSPADLAGVRSGDELAGWEIHNDVDRPIVLDVRRGGKAEKIRFYPRGPALRIAQFRVAAASP
jgi:predicted metalloprotease with PDZ domain